MTRSKTWNNSLFALLIAVAASTFANAENPDPEALEPRLGESEALFARIAASASFSGYETPSVAGPPAWAPIDPKEAEPLRRRAKVRTVMEMEKFNTDQPPATTIWRNYPLYAVAGLPRDLVDGFFGSMSFVPPFNLLFTGLCYEIIPTQALVRPAGDRHGPGGQANANGHGWIEAINGWGFFPHLEKTEFHRVDLEKSDIQHRYNERLDRRIAEANATVEAHNKQVDVLRQEYLDETTRHYRAGNYPETIRRSLCYTLADPVDRHAKMMLIVSLVAGLAENPHRQWAHTMLEERMPHGARALTLIKDDLLEIEKNHPTRREPPLYLSFVNLRLFSFAQALGEAEHLLALDIDNPLYQRLYLEVAITSRQPAWIDAAVAFIESKMGADSLVARHARGRRAFVLEDYPAAVALYADLTQAQPANACFHYLRGMAEVGSLKKTGRFDRHTAEQELERAMQLAPNPGDKSLFEKALRATRLLREEDFVY